jgi:hypothetical protein
VSFDMALWSAETQTLWADVMHIKQNSFFVSVAEPMQLIMVNHIKSEDTESLGKAPQDQLNLLRERNFQPQLVYIDPASGHMNLRTQFPGVEHIHPLALVFLSSILTYAVNAHVTF